MTNNKYEIGQRLHSLRAERKMTIEQLSDRLGISVSHINQLERGYRNMSIDLLMKYINEFDVDANCILMAVTDGDSDTMEYRLGHLPTDSREFLTKVFDYMIQASERQEAV